jgi:uridine kinase
MNNKPFVISISAVSGGGKTTIINLLEKKLGNSTSIYFDDYEFKDDPGDNQFNENLIKYDYNKWELKPLIKDIENVVYNTNYTFLLLDYPFSYVNVRLKHFINFSVFIDTPLDVAMARRIIRDYNNKTDIKNEMKTYLKFGRIGYLDMITQVKPSCDLICDGNDNPENIAGIIITEINKIYCA